LFLGKSTKTAATRAALFDSNMHAQHLPRPPIAVFRWPTSKGRRGIGEGRKMGGEGRGMGGKERGGRRGNSSFAIGRKKKSRRLCTLQTYTVCLVY